LPILVMLPFQERCRVNWMLDFTSTP
jgi:hypothetical protein